jgi:hypothetical protein
VSIDACLLMSISEIAQWNARGFEWQKRAAKALKAARR